MASAMAPIARTAPIIARRFNNAPPHVVTWIRRGLRQRAQHGWKAPEHDGCVPAQQSREHNHRAGIALRNHPRATQPSNSARQLRQRNPATRPGMARQHSALQPGLYYICNITRMQYYTILIIRLNIYCGIGGNSRNAWLRIACIARSVNRDCLRKLPDRLKIIKYCSNMNPLIL